jgi:hypothetical protein
MLDHYVSLPSARRVTTTNFVSRGNRLVDALPAAVRLRLQCRLRRVQAQEILFDCASERIVYFPHANTVVSLVRSTDEGPQLEVGMVGSEGCANLDLLLGGAPNGDTFAVVQVAGDVTCVSVARLHAEFSSDEQTRILITAYAAMFLEQVSQASVCNSIHTIAQRLSRWLLAVRDRTGSNDLVASHESLSRILGTQRPAVTLAIGALTEAGVIAHSRRSIRVSDASGLGSRACGCSDLMEKNLSRFRARLENRTA